MSNAIAPCLRVAAGAFFFVASTPALSQSQPGGALVQERCALAGLELFGVGACRSLFSDRPWLIAGLEMLMLGAIASVVAYTIGAGVARFVG